MNRINNCHDETSLGTILRCFNSPINEEQAWALCYQIVKYVVNQISITVDETSTINNDSLCQLNSIKTLDDVILLQDGSVHVPSVFNGTIYSSNSNNATLNVDIKCDKNSSKCFQSHVLHKKFIVSLGLILFQALDYGLSEDEERTLEPSLEILIERLTSADSEVSAVTSTTTSTHRGKCCSKRNKSNNKNVSSVNINDEKSKRIECSDGESDTEVPNELNDADDTDNDVTSCDEGIEEDSGGSSQPSSLKPENVSQSNNVEHKVNHAEENVTLSSSSSKNIGIKQINLSSSSLPDSTNLSDSKVCSNLFTMTSASGLNLNVILQMCKCHLVIPSADTSQYTSSSSIVDDYSSPDTHYKAVCRALFIEANELNAFLRQIALGSAALAKSGNNASTTTYNDFVMTTAASSSKTDSCISFDTSQLSLVELNNLAQADWARMWMQVIRDLRAGVKLKTVSADDKENRCTEYELTPYEMLLEDIRARRYKLKHVNVEDTNVNSSKLKKDAHELILEFIRSRPPLVPVSRRNLPPLPPRQQTIYEKLMASIRSQPVKLRPVPMPRTSRQGSLRLGRVCQSISKNDETVETSRTKFIEEEATPGPRRRLIKADFHLHLSSSFEDDDDELDNVNKIREDGETVTPTQENQLQERLFTRNEGHIDARLSRAHVNNDDDDGNDSSSSSTSGSSASSSDDVFDENDGHQSHKMMQNRNKKLTDDCSANSDCNKMSTNDYLPHLHVNEIHSKSEKKFNLRSLARFFTFDSDHDEKHQSSTSKDNRFNPSSGERRHSITVCETPRVEGSKFNFPPRPNRLGLLLHLNNNHITPDELIVDPNEDARDRVASVWSATNWGKAYSCLSLTLEEVQHIRSVLTRAELESLSVTRSLKEDLEKGRICFTCLKTRFGSFFGPFSITCKLCQRCICSKCATVMSVPSDCLAKVPIYMLSPSPSPPNEYNSFFQTSHLRSDDEHPSGTDGNYTTDDETGHTFTPKVRGKSLRRLNNNNGATRNRHLKQTTNKIRRGSSNVSFDLPQTAKTKLMRALTIGSGGGPGKSDPSTGRDTSIGHGNVVSESKTMRFTTVMKLCRDCKLLVRHIIDVGHTNYDSTVAASSSSRKCIDNSHTLTLNK